MCDVHTDGGIKSNEYTHIHVYVMYKTGYRYLTYISSIFRYYRYCMRIIWPGNFEKVPQLQCGPFSLRMIRVYLPNCLAY